MNTDETSLPGVSARTLAHYEASAAAFAAGTRDHDVSQNIDALLRHIEAPAPWEILDFGCGPGRDLATFQRMGHRATGLDGTAAFVEMARAATGATVLHQNFLNLDLPSGQFDGIFANAVLFHVPSSQLPKVLSQLREALKTGGVLFCSNPHGHNEEGWNGDRYGAYHDLPTWSRYLEAAGFAPLEHYYRPAGEPRERQPWLATVWRAA
jgi:SAM-dependent methyltransferase